MKVLVTKKVYPEAIDLLRRSVTVDYAGADEGISAGELRTRARDADGIVSQLTDRIDAAFIAGLDRAKVIANVAVGYDNVDVAAATARGIRVTNTPDVLTDTTADFAFALLMAAARRVVEAHQFVHKGEWRTWRIDLLVGHDIHHRTLGIFGMGRIGQAMARRAGGFSMRLLYHDARRAPENVERELGLEFAAPEVLLAESDFVTLHVPLLPETRHLIDAGALARMKRSSILVNTARGPVVDEPALIEALEQGLIAGAGLDVFEDEPRVPERLLALPNVVVAPHIASASIATRRRMSVMAAENALAVLAGREPDNPVNRVQ